MGANEPRSDKLCLRGSPAYAGALWAAGFDVVSVANNHSFDFGPEGFGWEVIWRTAATEVPQI
jgi:poly-gamma-glutamate capsule biosynthesis protein CapA/YwtB (metallophosphatase superfamily)